jgi:hypothetical protein
VQVLTVSRVRKVSAQIGLSAVVASLSAITPLLGDTQTKDSAENYYAHARLEQGASIGADFLGKYMAVRGFSIYSDEYIFVEVALYAPAGRRVEVSNDQFTLKINGRALTPQPPGAVTLEGNFPEMTSQPQVVLQGGTESGQIEIGGPERKPRFPGDDPAHAPSRKPPASTDPSGGQVEPKQQNPDEMVRSAELQTGTRALPISGYLFFSYEGKTKKIKHAQLEYHGPLGSAELTLR